MAEKYFAQPSTYQHTFSQVPAAEIERSRFDRSHGHKTTFDAGEIMPVYWDEILPGDTFTMNATTFARLATPLKPVMDNIFLDLHFFFVPYRLVWDKWQEFMGERKSPQDDNSNLVTPKALVNLQNLQPYMIAQHFGLPRVDKANAGALVNAFPFRAYKLIWNEWYRDENLQVPVVVEQGDGPDVYGTFANLKRGKRRDYFTSCLPWPQKGDPVYIPLGTSAPVITNSQQVTIRGLTDNTERNLQVSFPNSTNTVSYSGTGISTAQGVKFGNNSGLIADLEAATAITINDLRTAFQIQRLLERDARGGTRYIELILAHFGVRSDDGRLQRPEFLGGGTARISINPIAATNNTTDTAVGELAGFGTAYGKAGFQKSFTEHGIILGLASGRADLNYQNGIERMWWRTSRYDFYWPALSHLGEQAVLNREICFQSSTDVNDGDEVVFGYQERYGEYRYKQSMITGLFNSTAQTSLDVWHVAQDFDFNTPPVLNSSFIEENPAIDRVIAVPSEPHFLCDFWFDLQCDRPMPVYSVPGLIDHF